jgi:putative glutamine amidotransferase
VLVPTQSALKPRSHGGAQLVQSLNQAYVTALQSAGVSPVLIPTHGGLPEDLSWASGLLLPGGPDVDPQRYGQELDPTTYPDPASDHLEFALLDWALGKGIPILAICRGMQVLNVALGGSLTQDLPRHFPERHPEEPRPRDQKVHSLRIEHSSRLWRIVNGDTTEVNSMHHQGIDRLARPLVATGWAPDGLVEAVETRGDRFVLGVQYHPEELVPQDPAAVAIFETFAAACREGRSAGEKGEAELVTSA